MSKTIYAIGMCLVFVACVNAQNFPRWPPNSQVRVHVMRHHFSRADRPFIERAIEGWQAILPKGLSLTLAEETDRLEFCAGCITISRGSTSQKDRLGEISAQLQGQHIISAIVTVAREIDSGPVLQAIVAHEIGHGYGLDDCQRSDSIMGKVQRRGFWDSGYRARFTEPTPRDIALVRSLYPDQIVRAVRPRRATY